MLVGTRRLRLHNKPQFIYIKTGYGYGCEIVGVALGRFKHAERDQLKPRQRLRRADGLHATRTMVTHIRAIKK